LIGTGLYLDSGPHDTIIIVIHAPDFNPERVRTQPQADFSDDHNLSAVSSTDGLVKQGRSNYRLMVIPGKVNVSEPNPPPPWAEPSKGPCWEGL